MNPIIFPILIYSIGIIAAVVNTVTSEDMHGRLGWGIAAALFGILLFKHLGF